MSTGSRSRFDWAALLGYDIFISYKRSAAASTYSRNLRNALSDLGFKCFLDQEQTEGGVELAPVLRKALRRSRLLVVLAEPNVVHSAYVPEEIRTFLARRKGRIVPINVGAFLQVGKAQPAPFDYLQTITWLDEPATSFDAGSPTDSIVAGIRTSFGRVRVAALSRVITWTAIIILATAAIVALVQRQAAVRESELSLAQAYASDLNLAEIAHDRRDTPAVLELLTRYAGRRGEPRLPEFAWRRFWGLYNGERHRLAHEPTESGLAISPDGRTLVTTARLNSESGGGSVRVWELGSGRLLQTIDLGRWTNAGAAAFAPDARTFAVMVNDFHELHEDHQQIVLLETATGRRLRTIEATGAVGWLAFTPDGTGIVAPCAAGINAPFQIWDVGSGASRHANVIEEDSERLTAWAYARDGRTVAVAFDEQTIRGVVVQRHISIWDAASRTLRANITEGDTLLGGLQVIGGLAYSPDGRTLAAALGASISGSGYSTSPDGRVRLWDADSGRPLGVLSGHKAGAHALAFSHDGTLIASASGEPDASSPGKDSQVIVWDARTRKPIATLDQGQTGFVVDMAFSPVGSVLALVAEDAIVTLVDAAKGQVLTQLRGHSRAITSTAFTSDGGTLVTTSLDGSTRIWDTGIVPELQRFDEPGETVVAAAFSKDGGTAAVALKSGGVILEDAESLRTVRHILPTPAPVQELAFSADGHRLAAHTGEAVIVWDVDTATVRQQIAGASGVADAIRLDERGLVVTAAVEAGLGSKVTIERWDVDTGRRLTARPLDGDTLLAISDDGASVAIRNFFVRNWSIETRDVPTGRVFARMPAEPAPDTTAAAFSHDGSRLAIAESGRYVRPRAVRIVDARTLQPIAELPRRSEGVHTLTFDDTGHTLVTGGYSGGEVATSPRSSFYQVMNHIRIWDLADGAVERSSVSVESAEINGATRERQSRLHVLAGGRILAVKELATVMLVDARTGRVITASQSAPATIHSIRSTSDSRTLVVTVRPGNSGANDVVTVWDARRHTVSATLPQLAPAEAWSMAFSKDGRRLAVGSEADTVRLYDTTTAAVTSVLEGRNGPVLALAFGNDGSTLTTAAADGSAHRWDIATGRATPVGAPGPVIAAGVAPGGDVVAGVAADGTLRARAVPGGAGVTARIDSPDEVPLAFAPDGKTFAAALRVPGGAISIRSRDTGKEVVRLQADAGIRAIAFSREGLVAAGFLNGRVALWQLPNSQQIASLPAQGSGREDRLPPPSVISLAFDPATTRLAVGHADGTIALWEKRPDWTSRTLNGHAREVRALAFAPGGSTLASADTQGRVALWNAAGSGTPEMRVMLRYDAALQAARISPDGKVIATAGNDKAVVLWDLATGKRQPPLLGHTSPIESLMFSGNGQRLASASSTEVITWDPVRRSRLTTVRGSAPMHISADGDRLATTLDEHTVAVWRADSGGQQVLIQNLPDRPKAMAFSADARTLAILAGDRATLWDARIGRALQMLSGYQGNRFAAIAMAPDGNTLATGSDGRVDLWHLLTGRRLLTLREIEGAVSALDFSSDGVSLVAATSNGVRVWTAAK